jgi:hypothetical protein
MTSQMGKLMLHLLLGQGLFFLPQPVFKTRVLQIFFILVNKTNKYSKLAISLLTFA